MATLLTPAQISKETYCRFQNNLVLARSVSWDFDNKFAKAEAQIGDSIGIRKRANKLIRRNDPAWSAANAGFAEYQYKLVIDRELNANIVLTDTELTLKVEDFGNRVINPITVNMASMADSDLAGLLSNFVAGGSTMVTGGIANGTATSAVGAAYAVGAYGNGITPSIVTYAHKVLQDFAMPDDGEVYGVLSTTHNRQLVLAQATLFNTLGVIDAEYKKGLIGKYDGIEFSMSQSLVKHTNGAQATLVVSAGTIIDGSFAETANLTVTATGAAINPGDVFQANTVFVVNPLTKVVTDTPAQFTVVAAAPVGAGATTVTVYPAPLFGGDNGNISATINGVTLQLTGGLNGASAGSFIAESNAVGSGATGLGGVESLVFHKTAIQAASPEMYTPSKGVSLAVQIKDEEAPGFKFRMVKAWDNFGVAGVGGLGTARAGEGTRLDAIYGFKVVAPWVIRIRG